jgi:RNA polymerase subunit RPABC4/transcription elongation factor Spt4
MSEKYCQNCGEASPLSAKFCRYCGVEIETIPSRTQPPQVPSPARRMNRYDEGVKEWFSSKTFKTILTIGLVLGCSFAACTIFYYGSLISLLGGLFSLVSQPEYPSTPSVSSYATMHEQVLQLSTPHFQPYIVRTLNENNPIGSDDQDALNVWLESSAPVDVQYWFITGWNEKDGKTFVSLAGVDLTNADEEWDMMTSDKVRWAGMVIIVGGDVFIYSILE